MAQMATTKVSRPGWNKLQGRTKKKVSFGIRRRLGKPNRGNRVSKVLAQEFDVEFD